MLLSIPALGIIPRLRKIPPEGESEDFSDDIPLLVARLCNNRFHTLLRASYESIPVNRDMVGKIYGSDPAVSVIMDFESVLLGEVFRRLMPQVIREDYEVRCREADKCEEES